MKKVLIIAFPFSQEVIGAVRLRGLAKFLLEFGWKPTILTIKSSKNSKFSYKIIEVEYNNIFLQGKEKKVHKNNSKINEIYSGSSTKNRNPVLNHILDMYDEVFAYPDLQKNWYTPAAKKGTKLLKKEDFDAIISSSAPVTSHLVANKLKEKFDVPWVADLRDLWTQNPYYKYGPIRKFFERRLEIKTLNNADYLTTTTPYSAEYLKKLHKREDVCSILNGFDTNQKIENISLSDKLNLTYSGNLYSGKRDPQPLFRALKELSLENSIELTEFSIDLYTPVKNWLIKEIEKYGLQEVVNLNGMISREEILKIQRKSQILLLLSWNNPQEQGIIPGKIYEYFAAGRPILSIGPPEGLVKDLIESTNSGIHLSEYNTIKKAIKNLYDEFKLNGKIQYNGIPEEINKYHQKEMAKKFALILDKISK